MTPTVNIDGRTLTLDALRDVAEGRAKVTLDAAAAGRMREARAVVDRIVASGAAVYGVTTGFGKMSDVRIPPQSNIQLRTSFNLTPKWAATWSTNYDFQRSEFGLQSVTLQREMHDWKAVFGFTQAPNGAFTFTFFVSLKAEPDLKFDYNRATYGQQNGLISR